MAPPPSGGSARSFWIFKAGSAGTAPGTRPPPPCSPRPGPSASPGQSPGRGLPHRFGPKRPGRITALTTPALTASPRPRARWECSLVQRTASAAHCGNAFSFMLHPSFLRRRGLGPTLPPQQRAGVGQVAHLGIERKVPLGRKAFLLKRIAPGGGSFHRGSVKGMLNLGTWQKSENRAARWGARFSCSSLWIIGALRGSRWCRIRSPPGTWG